MSNFIHLFALALTLLTCGSCRGFFTNLASFDGGRFKVHWTLSNASDTFYFRIEVEAKGWIAFGITELNSSSVWMRDAMHSYDVLVCGVYGKNGTYYGLDYLTAYKNRTQYPDHVDAVNDWNITYAEETGNKTIMEFNRKRVPSEPMKTHEVPRKGDIIITPGLRYFAWAYHMTIDTPYLDSLSLIHDRRGLYPVTLIPKKDDTREPIHITYPSPTRGGAGRLDCACTVSLVIGTMVFYMLALLIG